MSGIAIANDRILAKDETARIIFPIVAGISVPVRETPGG
jgi:hypothetical protein